MTDVAPDEPAPAADRVLFDERTALRFAGLVASTHKGDAAAAEQLRARIDADVPDADAAARRWSGLGHDLPPAQVAVVSRLGWVRVNLVAMRGAFDPLASKLGGRRVPARALGAQLGGLLGLLSSKVLGQYVLPLAPGRGVGTMVMVGPNLLELGARAGPRADDVRRSVLLHELTHRLQFEAVPWLADHLRDIFARYLSSARFDPGRLLEIVSRLPRTLRSPRAPGSLHPIVEAVLTDEQASLVHEAQALMSLIEGHGNAAMEGAAEGIVDDPAGVREALKRRRPDAVSRVLSTVAGLEMKRQQYQTGEAFVRAVVDRVGTEGLNRAFAAPEALPTPDEVAEPARWLDRMGHDDGG